MAIHQLQRASALSVLINAISIWDTAYLQKAIDYLKSTDSGFNEKLLKHIAPLGWEHINFLGEYNFDVRKRISIRQIKTSKCF